MQEVLENMQKLRDKSRRYGDSLSKLPSYKSKKLSINPFNAIYNDLTLCLELLDFYYNIWSNQAYTSHIDTRSTKQENGERVILIQKIIFISILSTIEFCFKEFVKKYPQKIGDCKNNQGFVYLRNVMKESKRNSVIDQPTLTNWLGVIEHRNNLVHNNGISEQTKDYCYPNYTLKLRTGKMTRGDLLAFPHLINWLLDQSKEWIEAMAKK